jgi:hypothetical protein
MPYDSSQPGPNHPNYPHEQDNPIACPFCSGTGCAHCGNSGGVPEWTTDPEITGH